MMKAFIFGMTGILLFCAQGALAVTVNHLSFDVEQKYVLAQVSYLGGCGKHQFKLKMGMCTRSLPPTCYATLLDDTQDRCVEKQVGTVVLPFADYGFNGPMWNRATLVVNGSREAGRGKSIRFPAKSSASEPSHDSLF